MLHSIFNRKELLPPDDALQKQKANSKELKILAMRLGYLRLPFMTIALKSATPGNSLFPPPLGSKGDFKALRQKANSLQSYLSVGWY